MNIKQLREQIRLLAAQTNLSAEDLSQCREMLNHFTAQDDRELSPDDLQFITQQYHQRWLRVRRTPLDYTRNEKGINAPWIELAKLLYPKHYLKLLISNLEKNPDPNGDHLRDDIQHPEHVFIGDGHILYSKRGLGNYIFRNQNQLVTKRPNGSETTLSLDELASIMACTQDSEPFTLSANDTKLEIINFASFMNNAVVTQLRSSLENQNSLILCHFLHILGIYIVASKGGNFDTFPERRMNFYTHLYAHKLRDVNAFYGLEVTLHGRKQPLLHFLIKLHEVDDFSLVSEVEEIITNVFAISPIRENINEKLASLQEQHRLKLLDQKQKLDRCLNMILSMFVLELQSTFAFSLPIYAWDQRVRVWSEVRDLYENKLFPLLSKPELDEEQLIHVFTTETRIIPPQSFWNAVTNHSNAIATWLTNARDGTLENLPSHGWGKKQLTPWYGSRELMHALLNTRPMNQALKTLLDNIVSTFVQYREQGYTLAELRINILFNNYFNQLEPSQRLRLKQSLAEHYQDLSLRSLCLRHIDRRLQEEIPASCEDARFKKSADLMPISQAIGDEQHSDVREIALAFRNKSNIPTKASDYLGKLFVSIPDTKQEDEQRHAYSEHTYDISYS